MCPGPVRVDVAVGDEFVIIIEDTTGEHDVAALAEEILAAMAASIRVGDHELIITTSIGVVERPVANTNPADLMQAADITLYRAKAEVKARWCVGVTRLWRARARTVHRSGRGDQVDRAAWALGAYPGVRAGSSVARRFR